MTAAKGNRKGKIVSSKNSSPDGVDEDPTAVEGLSIGGWFSEADRGEDGERFTLAKTLGTNALLPGRQVRALRRGMAIAG